MNNKEIILKITTVSISLDGILKGQLAYLNRKFCVVGLAGGNKLVLNSIKERENVVTHHINFGRRVFRPLDILGFLQLLLFIVKYRPRIVHSYTPKAGLISMCVAKLMRVPIRIHTVTGMPVMLKRGLFKRVLLFAEYLTYKFATEIQPNSHGLKDYILQHKLCSESKIEIIGNGSSNGIDLNFWNPEEVTSDSLMKVKKLLKHDSNDFTFIFIGRVTRDKGVELLIEAFSLFTEESVRLLIIGPMETELDPLDSKCLDIMHLDERIYFSNCFIKDVRPYLLLSNCLVLPSYREGFPNVVLQAGALGKPSIVSNINGSNEIISENFNGYIHTSGNVLELYRCMRLAYKNKLTLNSLGLNARLNIEEKYSNDILWSELEKRYLTLIDHQKP